MNTKYSFDIWNVIPEISTGILKKFHRCWENCLFSQSTLRMEESRDTFFLHVSLLLLLNGLCCIALEHRGWLWEDTGYKIASYLWSNFCSLCRNFDHEIPTHLEFSKKIPRLAVVALDLSTLWSTLTCFDGVLRLTFGAFHNVNLGAVRKRFYNGFGLN